MIQRAEHVLCPRRQSDLEKKLSQQTDCNIANFYFPVCVARAGTGKDFLKVERTRCLGVRGSMKQEPACMKCRSQSQIVAERL